MKIVWLSFALVALTGCVSHQGMVVRAVQGTDGEQLSLRVAHRIAYDGAGWFILPDGTRAAADPQGGFVLPNGLSASPDGAGGIVISTGARCRGDGPGGYICA